MKIISAALGAMILGCFRLRLVSSEVTPEYINTLPEFYEEIAVNTVSTAHGKERTIGVPVVVLWEMTTVHTYRVVVSNYEAGGDLYDSGVVSGKQTGVTPMIQITYPGEDGDLEYQVQLHCENGEVREPTCVGTLTYIMVACGSPDYLPTMVAKCTYADIATATSATCTN